MRSVSPIAPSRFRFEGRNAGQGHTLLLSGDWGRRGSHSSRMTWNAARAQATHPGDGAGLTHATAQSSESVSACSITVWVALACRSGG
jgi:hypothetical protein